MFSKMIAVVCFMPCLSSVMASDFSGPYFRGTVGLASGQTELRQYNPDTQVMAHSGLGKIAMGYTWQIDTLHLGVNAFSVLGNLRTGSIQGEDFLGLWRDDFKLTKIHGLAIEPGMRFNTTLVYLSAALVHAKGSNTYSYDGGDDKGEAIARHRGIGLGIGFRHPLTSKLELTGEVQHLRFKRQQYYSDVTESYQPAATLAGMGLAYKF